MRKKRPARPAAKKVPAGKLRKRRLAATPAPKRAAAGARRRPGPAASADPVLERVRAAIHSVRPAIPLARIRPEASLVSDLGIDSLSLAQLSIALEDAFGRAIFLGDVFSELEDPVSITVGQLARLITREP